MCRFIRHAVLSLVRGKFKSGVVATVVPKQKRVLRTNVSLTEENFMARGIFPHEIADPDFQWLIKNYCETRGPVAIVDAGCLPIVMVLLDEKAQAFVNQDIVSHNIMGVLAGGSQEAPPVDDTKKEG